MSTADDENKDDPVFDFVVFSLGLDQVVVRVLALALYNFACVVATVSVAWLVDVVLRRFPPVFANCRAPYYYYVLVCLAR